MTKKTLSESDICAEYITPAVIQAGWDEAIRRALLQKLVFDEKWLQKMAENRDLEKSKKPVF